MSRHKLKPGDRVRLTVPHHPSGRRCGEKGTVETVGAFFAGHPLRHYVVRMDLRPDERRVVFLADEIEPIEPNV